MPDVSPRRSVLYVPADKPRAIAKARTLPLDAVVFDLEDSIAPEAKAAARESLREALAQPFACEVAVRINALDTEWATEDILAAVALRVDAILVPKVTGPGDLRMVAAALEQSDVREVIDIWAMIETPKALLHLGTIAALADQADVPLAAFLIGVNDLALAMRLPPSSDRLALVHWFTQIVGAARAYGVDVIDGPCNDFRDLAQFEAECRQAHMLGMDGKSLIHPAQVEAANRIFAPSAEERAAAAKIAAAFALPQNAGRGVIALDGRMVERLHLEGAERVMALAAAIDERDAG